MKENAESVLGSSRENAVTRLWARPNKNKTMANLYKASMKEYEYLRYMTEIKIENTKMCLIYPSSCCV